MCEADIRYSMQWAMTEPMLSMGLRRSGSSRNTHSQLRVNANPAPPQRLLCAVRDSDSQQCPAGNCAHTFSRGRQGSPSLSHPVCGQTPTQKLIRSPCRLLTSELAPAAVFRAFSLQPTLHAQEQQSADVPTRTMLRDHSPSQQLPLLATADSNVVFVCNQHDSS